MAFASSIAPSFLSRALGPLLGIWQSRSRTERVLIVIASVLILLVMAGSLVDWLSTERKRLARILPRLENQMTGMDAATKEMAALRLQPTIKESSLSLQAFVEAVTTRVKEQGLNLTVTGVGEAVGVRGTAPFDRSVQLLGILHKENGLRVQKAEILRQENGQASVDFVLIDALRR